MAEENIKLTKIIYSTKSTDGLVDRSFSEFFKSKDPINVDRFFSIYEELFYDIPKVGEKSHTSVIKQSTDYIKNYIDPRDEQITTLTERIIELENELATPTEEHPFYSNGTLIAPDVNNNNNPDDEPVYYMDKGKKRLVSGGSKGVVFKALIASLGFKAGTSDIDIVKVVPKVILDSIDEGSLLESRDLTGQTAAEELEQQTNILASIVVNNWRQELNDIIQPIEDGSMSSEILYINLLKNKINNEYSREGSLESQTWKYYQDSINGFTEEEREVGRKLYEIALPKLNKSRQILAILARIWKKRENFPNINFNDGSILPKSTTNGDGISLDKNGNPQIINPLLDSELRKFSSGDKGKELFPGVLEGEDYLINLNNLEYNGKTANQLLDEGLIKVRYEVKGINQYGSTYALIQSYRFQNFSYHKNDDSNQQFKIGNRQYTFRKYIYA
tara:strand:- start:9039 stop:10376 length:1338 start_codon:yes stop_codon:yes gene_type:complete